MTQPCIRTILFVGAAVALDLTSNCRSNPSRSAGDVSEAIAYNPMMFSHQSVVLIPVPCLVCLDACERPFFVPPSMVAQGKR